MSKKVIVLIVKDFVTNLTDDGNGYNTLIASAKLFKKDGREYGTFYNISKNVNSPDDPRGSLTTRFVTLTFDLPSGQIVSSGIIQNFATPQNFVKNNIATTAITGGTKKFFGVTGEHTSEFDGKQYIHTLILTKN